MKPPVLEKEIAAAEALIKRDPATAAFMLADKTVRLFRAETTLYTVRTFAQNPTLASEGDKGRIEFALQRDL